MVNYVIQVTACPLDSPDLRDGIEQFTEISMVEYGAPESDYWFHREQQGPTLAADENGRWYLTCCNILEATTRDRLFPVGKWPVEEMTWHYEEHRTRPTKQQCDDCHNRVLQTSGLTRLGPRGPLDEMFARTWELGDRNYREYIQETIREKQKRHPDNLVCLKPKSPVIGDAQSDWYGVVQGTPATLSAMHLAQDDTGNYVSHNMGAAETLTIWMDDPLFDDPVQRGAVDYAMVRLTYRSAGVTDCCLAELSSPNVFSTVPITSVVSDDWQTHDIELQIESPIYADWADLILRICPSDLPEDCSPIEIGSIMVCVDGSST